MFGLRKMRRKGLSSMKGRHRKKKSWGKLLKRAFFPPPHYFHLKICFICSSASFRDCPQELRGLRGVLDAPADSPGTLCWQLMKKNLSGLGDIALSCWVSPLLSLHFVKLLVCSVLFWGPFPHTQPAIVFDGSSVLSCCPAPSALCLAGTNLKAFREIKQ